MTLHLTLHRTFVADHFHDLPGFREKRHGHNWEIEATARLETLADEAALSTALEAWVKQVDYTLLNEQTVLADRNPTTEALAHWAFSHLEALGLVPVLVKVREKANYWAACRRAIP